MKIITYFLLLLALVSQKVDAQEFPLNISVPQVTSDANQQYQILNYNVSEDGNSFSILYLQELEATVKSEKEFNKNPGEYAFQEKKMKSDNFIANSNKVLLLIRQVVNKNGEGRIDKSWVLAERKMESAEEYRMTFNKRFTHPILPSDAPITLTIHNLDNVQDLNGREKEALTVYIKKFIFPDPGVYVNPGRESTLGESIADLKSQFKTLRTSGAFIKGTLPKGESVLTKFEIVPKKNFVVTKQKGEPMLLKFYLTPDYTDYELVDSLFLDGDVTVTSILHCYNKNTSVAGLMSGFHYKYKDGEGNSQSQILLVGLNEDDELGHWLVDAGKNKLNSLSPEVCYVEDKKFTLVSSNIEKIFKPYYQVHQLEIGKPGLLTFPLTEEDRKTVNQSRLKSLQVSDGKPYSAGPLAQKHIPLWFTNFEAVRYMVTQSYARDVSKNLDVYMGLEIYRLDGDRITDVYSVDGYQSDVAIHNEFLVQSDGKQYTMLGLPTKIQLTLDKTAAEIKPIESATSMLVPDIKGSVITENDKALIMLTKTRMGTKYSLLVYWKE